MKRFHLSVLILFSVCFAAPASGQLQEDPAAGSGVAEDDVKDVTVRVPKAAELPADADRIRLEVESARDELHYRMGRARRAVSKQGLGQRQLDDVTGALDRSIRDIQSGFGSLETAEEIRDAQTALEKLAAKARAEATDLRKRAQSGTKDAVEAAAKELDQLAEALEAAARELGDEIRNRQARTAEPVERPNASRADTGTDDENDDSTQTASVYRSDEVRFAGDVVVLAYETVGDVVAIGGDIRVSGVVRGDAVAIGGNIYVGESAIIHGDAVAVGGLVRIQPGGQVYGEKKSAGDISIGGSPF